MYGTIDITIESIWRRTSILVSSKVLPSKRCRSSLTSVYEQTMRRSRNISQWSTLSHFTSPLFSVVYLLLVTQRTVVSKILQIYQKLLSVRFFQVPNAKTWHKDATQWAVWESEKVGKEGGFLGYMHLDLFRKPHSFLSCRQSLRRRHPLAAAREGK